MWAKGGDRAQAALTASQGCVWHQALTLTCGFDAAYPSGTGIIPGPPYSAGSKSPHRGQDSAGHSRIMAANATLPAAVRADTCSSYSNPAACLGLSLRCPQHTHPQTLHPTDLVGFCLIQGRGGLMFCGLCSLTVPAPAPREGCCGLRTRGASAWLQIKVLKLSE